VLAHGVPAHVVAQQADDFPRNQGLHHAPLLRVGLAQDGVQRGHDGHPQFAQQRQQMTAGRPAVDPELVLHAHQVRVADVQKLRRALVGGQVLLLDLKANDAGILVAARDVVDRHRKTLGLRMLRRHGGKHVGGERRDAAFARQIVAEKRNLANVRCWFHNAVTSVSALWRRLAVG